MVIILKYFYQKVSSILNTVDECKTYFENNNVENIKLYIQDGRWVTTTLG